MKMSRRGCANYCFLIAVVLTLLFLYINFWHSQSPSLITSMAPSATPTETPYIKITSSQLIDEYYYNRVKCMTMYDDKPLEITGIVKGITTGNETCILIGGGASFINLDVEYHIENKDIADMISDINEGDTITVRGKCNVEYFSIFIEN